MVQRILAGVEMSYVITVFGYGQGLLEAMSTESGLPAIMDFIKNNFYVSISVDDLYMLQTKRGYHCKVASNVPDDADGINVYVEPYNPVEHVDEQPDFNPQWSNGATKLKSVKAIVWAPAFITNSVDAGSNAWIAIA